MTEAGQSCSDACKRTLADLAEVERVAAGEYASARGELIVTAPVALGCLHGVPVVTECLLEFLDVDIRLMLSDRVLHLQEDGVDLALPTGTLPDSALKAVNVGTVDRVICGSPDHFAPHDIPDQPGHLANHRCKTATGFRCWTAACPPNGAAASAQIHH